MDILYILTGERSRLRTDAISPDQQTMLMNFQAMNDTDQTLFIQRYLPASVPQTALLQWRQQSFAITAIDSSLTKAPG